MDLESRPSSGQTTAPETQTRKYYSSPESRTEKETLRPISESQRPFSRTNILLMCGCLAMIIIGFVLMSGPGSSEQTGFNPDIFSTRRIVVGPAMAFLGFLCMAFAIIYTPGKRKKGESNMQD